MPKKKHSKRYVQHLKSYSAFEAKGIEDAVNILKNTDSHVKFDETVELSLGLSLDPRKNSIKSYAVFPNNFKTKKQDRQSIIFFCDAKDFSTVEAFGVRAMDESSFASLKNGEITFTACYCFSDYLPKLVPLARFLGQKGLMPNAKLGTVIEREKLESSFSESTKVQFKNSSDAYIRVPVGTIGMQAKQIAENISFFLGFVMTLKPTGIKNFQIKNCHVSMTMGASVKLLTHNF